MINLKTFGFFEDIWRIFIDSSLLWKCVTVLTLILVCATTYYYSIGINKYEKRIFEFNCSHLFQGDPSSFLLIDANGLANQISLAMLVEVVNRQDEPVKIVDYYLEIYFDKKWHRFFSCPVFKNNKLCWVKSSALCNEISFEDGYFDLKASKRFLKRGDSVRGWMFSRSPSDLALSLEVLHKSKVRIALKNNSDEWQFIPVKFPNSKDSNTWLQAAAIKILKVDIPLSDFKFEKIKSG